MFAGPADKGRACQLLDQRHEHRRWYGEVVDPVRREAPLVLDDVEAGAERRERAGVFERSGRKEQGLRKSAPRRLVDGTARKLRDAVLRERPIVVVTPRRT